MEGYKISFSLLVVILTVVYSTREQNPCDSDFGLIPCDDGECINRWYWCDGDSDCQDGSDEKYCDITPDQCTDKHFFCGHAKCIPVSLKCDNQKDCDNNADEDNCNFHEPTYSSESVPDNVATSTTTTEIYTLNRPSSTDYYDTRRDEHNNRNLYQDLRPTSPPFVRHDYNYDARNYHQNVNYNEGYANNYFERRTMTQGRENPYNNQQRPTINHHQPAFHPEQRNTASHRDREKRPDYSHFYFSKNYTADFEYDYRNNIRDAKDWLLGKRDNSYNWDRNTPRALIALSLISNSFKSDEKDNELMKKSLQTHLGIKILRNNTGIEKMSTTRLAMYINALLATCQNPRDFLGIDLVQTLRYKQNYLEQHQRFVNPLIYLSLCLMDFEVDERYLETFLKNSFPTEISKDLHILATTAMACISQRHLHDNKVRAKLDEAAQNLLKEMNPVNGSFGSKYSTALAVQALMSVNISRYWDPRKTLDYLAQQQHEDGSFGDMQSTYYTLIALSGRSLLHLRNTLCDVSNVTDEWSPEDILSKGGPNKTVLYSVNADYPRIVRSSQHYTVPLDTNFYDIMRVAAYLDPRLKFDYKISNDQLGVHTIANIPNDPERGMFWNLYYKPSSSANFGSRYTEDLRRLRPNENDQLFFMYQSDF